MATAQPAVKLTYEDYRAAPADTRYELVDGELIMVPAPNIKHQDVQFRLALQLGKWIVEHGLGRAFNPPCDVVLSDHNTVQPDSCSSPGNGKTC